MEGQLPIIANLLFLNFFIIVPNVSDSAAPCHNAGLPYLMLTMQASEANNYGNVVAKDTRTNAGLAAHCICCCLPFHSACGLFICVLRFLRCHFALSCCFRQGLNSFSLAIYHLRSSRNLHSHNRSF